MSRTALALGALIAIPSSGLAVKFLGRPLAAAYMAAVLALAACILAIERRERLAALARRHEKLVAAAWVLFMAAALGVLYPIARSHALGPGSDRVDALMVGIQALLDGRYPYYERVAGGGLSPMPAALLIGVPFHLLGGVVLQNFVFALAGAAVLAQQMRTWRTRWLIIALLSLGNIGFMQDYVTGGDFATAGIYLGIAFLGALGVLQGNDVPPRRLAAAGMVLGLFMGARPLYPVAGLVLSAHALRRHGLPQALTFAGFAFGTAGIICLPFYFYDPAHFAPLQILSFLPRAWRFLDYLLPPVSMLIAVLPAVRSFGPRGLFGILACSLAAVLLPGAMARFAIYPVSPSYLVPVALLAAGALLAGIPPATPPRESVR